MHIRLRIPPLGIRRNRLFIFSYSFIKSSVVVGDGEIGDSYRVLPKADLENSFLCF
jgi:hypothetical protein